MQTKTYTFRLLLSLMLAASLGFAGCGDDSEGPQKDTGTADQGVKYDRGVQPDTGTPDSTTNDMRVVDNGLTDNGLTDSGDQGVQPDQGPAAACDPACLSIVPWLCATYDDECVECTEDAHCAANPNALGPRCDTDYGWCVCAGDGDCAGNPNGTKCDLDYFICSCESDNDCSAQSVCKPENSYLDGFPLCQTRCTSNADCSAPTPTCDTTSGNCVECLDNSACGGDYPYCNSTTNECVACETDQQCSGDTPFCSDTGSCVECKDNSQCTTSLVGGLCDGGYCGCLQDGDCALSSYASGNTCVSLWGLFQFCGCEDDSSCTSNPHGPTCNDDWMSCGCEDDTNCTAAPYTKCAFELAGYTYEHCQEPCTSNDDCADKETLPICSESNECIQCLADGDCTDPAAPRCNTDVGMCVRCLGNDDCTPGYPFCNASINECVECSETSHCADSLNGAICDAEQGVCTCAVDGDCDGNRWGSVCVDFGSGSMRCGCEAAADCGSNPNGPTCYTQYAKCSCADDTECITVGELSECALPYAGSAYSHCQAPCANSDACAATQQDTGLPVCYEEKCVECATDDDCTGDWFNSCSDNACLMCTEDADCDASSLGSTCDTTNYYYCTCASDADCANNANGGVCDGDYSFCSCVTDNDCPGGRTCSRPLYTTGVMLCQ